MIVDLYHIEPDGVTESFLKTVHFGAIHPGKEKTKEVFDPNDDMWVPTQRGRNWIRGDIYVKGFGKEMIFVNEFKESFNVVPGWRPVVSIPGNWVINEPTEIYNATIIVAGDIYVNDYLYLDYGTVIADDLIVNASKTIGANEDIDINATSDGQYKVEVNPNGTLNVYGLLTNNPDDAHYWFYMNGTLLVGYDPELPYPPGIVENTYGSSDLSQPGGIICTTDNVTIENGASVRYGATHGVYLMGSNATISGANIHDNGADGIVCVEGASPTIESGTNISWNGRHGIYVEGASPVIKDAIVQWNGRYHGGNGITVRDATVSNTRGVPDYTPGVDIGTFVWWDETGWHLRFSSDSENHTFNVTIKANGDVRSYDLLVSGGTEKTDDFAEYDEITLDVLVDGAQEPGLVFIGELSINPDSLPVTLSVGPVGKISGSDISLNMVSGIRLENTNIPVINNDISSNGMSLKFRDDMESGAAGWSASGLWHRVNNESGKAPAWNISHSGDWSWWYGNDLTGNYETSAPSTNGSLTSPPIDLFTFRKDGLGRDVKVDFTTASLSFWSWYETDTTGSQTDQRWITIRDETYEERIQLFGDEMNQWMRYVINITEFAGGSINVTFEFNSVDAFNNSFRGWYIDDVEIVASYPLIEGHGILLNGGVFSGVSDNTIFRNNWNGIYCEDNIVDIMIWNNTIYENYDSGIKLQSSLNVRLSHNEIFKNNNGITLSNSNAYTVNDNNLHDNGYGVYVRRLLGHVPRVSNGIFFLSGEYESDIFAPDSILVGYNVDEQLSLNTIRLIEGRIDGKFKERYDHLGVSLFELNGEKTVQEAIESLAQDEVVKFAEPNFLAEIYDTPNDEYYGSLWGLNNIGQSGGKPDADIDAPEAWNISRGSGDVVVAVLDTGVDYTHPDLVDNLWNNPDETMDGIDNDGNGYVDDIFGINSMADSGDPMDNDIHGTHVSGTIGAVGNNSLGVTGVNWNVSIMALKWLDPAGEISDVLECIDYMIDKKIEGVNVKIASCSWGISWFSKSLYSAIEISGEHDILFVVACGNDHTDSEFDPHYPACYNLTNIISVAATDHDDELANFSCFGASVDVAAPGVDILSTTPSNKYRVLSGTSMATPHVSGLAALISSTNDSYNYNNLKNIILNNVDEIPSLADRVVTGGRINAWKSLESHPSQMNVLVNQPGNNSCHYVDLPIDFEISLNEGVCPILNASVIVRIETDGTTFALYDNGIGPDTIMNDGYYSGVWNTSNTGKINVVIDVKTPDFGNQTIRLSIIVIDRGSIRNNTIVHNSRGIGITLCSDIEVTNNNFTLNEVSVYVVFSSKIRISENVFYENFNGVIYYSLACEIYGNLFTDDHLSLSHGFHVVRKNVFRECSRGITLFSSNSNELHDNVFERCNYGMYLSSSELNTIINNIFMDDTRGLFISTSNSNSIVQNDFTNCLFGIIVTETNGTKIDYNRITSSQTGLEINSGSSFVEISNNVVSRCDSDGLLVFESKHIKIFDNNVSSNNDGIFFKDSEGEVINNTIVKNVRGIVGNDSTVIISANNVSKNLGTGIYLDAGKYDLAQNSIRQNFVPSSPGSDLTFTGIEIINCLYVNIDKNDVIGNHVNIYMEHSENIFIENNTISDGWAAIPEHPEYPIGILSESTSFNIHNNSFRGANSVMRLFNTTSVSYIKDNVINEGIVNQSTYGIYTYNASVEISDNDIYRCNQWAIYSVESVCTIARNNIHYCYDGIIMEDSLNPDIFDNQIISNYGTGITLSGVVSFTMSDNNVVNNQENGIEVLSSYGVASGIFATGNGDMGISLTFSTVFFKDTTCILNLGEYDTYSYYSTILDGSNNDFGRLYVVP